MSDKRDTHCMTFKIERGNLKMGIRLSVPRTLVGLVMVPVVYFAGGTHLIEQVIAHLH